MNSFNESQKRSFLTGFVDVHRRMAEMEGVIAQSATPSAFSQYVDDLSPTEKKVVQDYFARIRSTMLAQLNELGIPLEVRRTGLRWYLQVGMTFLHIAVAEMSPDRLAGYGPIDAAGRAAALKVQQELYRLIDRVAAYLRQGLGRDLQQRLARLEAAPADVATLRLLDRVVTRWQLVEFRPVLDSVIRRLEAPQFEVAVFGRVSSGKSSLLNHLAGMDVLPVGVTPVTAVPTRLVRGEEPAAVISFAEQEPRRVSVDQLRQYASEEGNPGNQKRVTGVVAQVPSPRLREGVVLVDTPGIGSLALAGSAETYAYLPRCDLGVVLIDAGSTLSPDDLGVLRLLYEAGIPAQVLISKADLLAPADRERLANYVREHLRAELGLDLPVRPVSTVGGDERLLTEWFERELEPLWGRHRALAEASLRRKIAHVRESVIAVLQTILARQQGRRPEGRGADLAGARRLLDGAEEVIRQARLRCENWDADESALVEIILEDAAKAVAGGPPGAGEGPVVPATRRVLFDRGRMARELLGWVQQELARTLQALGDQAPLAHADPAAVRDLALGELPIPDPSPLRASGRLSRPWWGSLLSRVAVWSARRSLEKRLGLPLRQLVRVYDRQVRAWLKSCIAQLVQAYESQAEVFREQARRAAGMPAAAGAPADVGDLLADLRELQENAEAGAGKEGGPPDAGDGNGRGSSPAAPASGVVDPRGE
jgi:GTP-binding protein EngB required for normal cell division